MAINAVFFDVGETLVSEARLWDGWAAYLDVSSEAFHAALDEAIAKGESHRTVGERFKPGLDIERARQERASRGDADMFDARDLYPDALPCLKTLREHGYLVGIAGNQPTGAVAVLRELGFEADVIASSSTLGEEKPSLRFFEKLQEAAKVPVSTIAYVGDRLDYDILPARAAGMTTIFIERGPWGRAHAKRPEIAQASLVVTSLLQIPGALKALSGVR
jgi:HAD superfamily hydrolase (TIGR01549 family)